LEQAKRRYKAGVGTITEISEAEANLEAVIAKILEWSNGLEYAKRGLENLTGVYPESYFTLDPEKLPLTKPDPAKVEDWIAIADSKNPDILAAQNDLEAARQEVSKNSSGHFPTLDLVASRAHSESESNNTVGSQFDTDSIGFQLNVPIYSGGYVNAAVRQAVARQEGAQEKLSGIQRAVAVEVRKYFNNVENGIARIQALEASVKSYETALIGTQKGFSAGVRSNIDVLDAQEKLYSSRRDLAKERYTLIYSRIQLKQSAGVLTDADIQESSGWLSMRP
jgi:protease secretion system outer membrane protein